jgi:hypothetical protein
MPKLFGGEQDRRQVDEAAKRAVEYRPPGL